MKLMLAWLKQWLPLVRPFLPYGIAAALALTALHLYNRAQQEQGAWAERDRVMHLRLDSLGKALDSTAKAFRVDTVKFRVTRQRWDTVRAGVDTQYLHDTLPVPVEVVREVVHAADTTIKACTQAVLDCSKGWALERAKSATLSQRIAGLERQVHPPLIQRVGGSLTSYALWRAVEAVVWATRK